jgi:choline dehydrogenase
MGERREHAFDMVVVGGGSAGCVLAARISEDPGCSVCLVEAGPDYGRCHDGRWPAEMLDARSVPGSHDWGYAGAGNLRSARVIGGCSALNGCLVAWGAPADYDAWVAAGASGWSFSDLEPYLRRAEARLRSRPLCDEEIGPWHRGVAEAAEEAGMPEVAEFNDPNSGPGVAFAPVNAVGTVRWNTAFAYLDPARGRRNLTVLDRTLVDRLQVDGERATIVLARRAGRELALAGGRIILAAGAYGSPAILLRSGIGPEEHLRQLKIPVATALAGVGAHLVDHFGLGVFFEPNEQLLAGMRRHDEGGRFFQVLCALKARSESRGSNSWDLHLVPWARPVDGGGYEVHMSVFAMHPEATGRVLLRSADPETTPLVEQGFLTALPPRDLSVVADGVRLARSLAGTSAIRELVTKETVPGRATEGEALARFIRANVVGYSHPVGTCKMGRPDDPCAVVDSSGRVHGYENLFVADASIMPSIPGANTNLTVVAAAERIAELRARRPRPTE